MTLQVASLEWAIDFVAAHWHGGETLFPKMPEIAAAVARKVEIAKSIANKQLLDFPAAVCRRFIVPKDEVSYRQATQLDPQDSIILAAIVFEYGSMIERRRLPADQVFSYRFDPTHRDGLYGAHSA